MTEQTDPRKSHKPWLTRIAVLVVLCFFLLDRRQGEPCDVTLLIASLFPISFGLGLLSGSLKSPSDAERESCGRFLMDLIFVVAAQICFFRIRYAMGWSSDVLVCA